MRLCSYVVKCDTGLAPNPFWRRCTLAVCTPNHQGVCVDEGDWIMGTGRVELGSKLIYAMELTEDRMQFNDYFTDKRFQKKKPVINGTWRQRCGDNFYYTKKGEWKKIPSVYHSGKDYIKKDTRYPYVFIGKHFYYFGKNAVNIPPRYKILIRDKQGAKCDYDQDIVKEFLKWLQKNYRPGIHGEPRDREKGNRPSQISKPTCRIC